jgi:hypothetical protein
LKETAMTTTNQTGRVVFTGTADWWRIVSDRGEVVTGEPWKGDWERAAGVAGIDTDDTESWVCRVVEVDDRHAAIRPGDYACCQGIGSDVAFVRLEG